MAGANLGTPCLLMCLLLLCGGLAQEEQRYWLKVQDLEVQEGLCALVLCTFNFPNLQRYSDIKVYWFREEVNVKSDQPVATNNERKNVSRDTQGRFILLSSPHSQNCSLSISNARWSDTGAYFFRVEYRGDRYSYKGAQQLLHIRVKALTQKPTIHISEPLVSGSAGTLICSLPGSCHKTDLSFSWAGEMINPNTDASSEIKFTPGLQDHGRNLSCRVTVLSTGKSTESTIQLNVSYAPQNLSTHVSFRATSGLGAQSMQLLCRADSNPPAEMSWIPVYLGTDIAFSNATMSGNDTTPENETVPQNMVTMEMHLVDSHEDAEFICQARNYLGTQIVSIRLSVPESLTNCSSESRGTSKLVLMLIIGTLMGAGFLLTYGLTWVYYSRCGGARGHAESPKSS